MDEVQRTVLFTLVTERGIRPYSEFSNEYARAAVQLQEEGRDVAPTPGPRHYERWLRVGGVKTTPYASSGRVLERMFQRPAAELFCPASAIEELGLERSPRASSPPALNESDLLMTARDAASHSSEAASLYLDEMTLDQLHDDLVQLARNYGRIAPAEAYQTGTTLLNQVQVLLDRTRSPQQHTKLYYAAAQASALLSALSFDLGALVPALTFARSSAQYGKTIENGSVQAYAHGLMALVAFWDSRPREAVRLARRGQEFGGLGDTARRRLYAIEARAHGHLRDAEQAERSIRDALDQTSGSSDELHDEIGGEFAFDDARTAMSNATTCLLLRDGLRAEEYAESALDTLSTLPTEEQPIVVAGPAAVDLARARLLRDEIEGAQEALTRVFQVPPHWRSSGLMERLAAARIELTRPGISTSPAALSLAEQIETYSALSPTRRLGATNPLAIEA
ncbi:hypothetical protein [Streptomyces sp. WAC08241]|uniref:hypothetical protein n=1 Tax=Streptomyces sp. WAC08241 TaxID=2487421 RepID=UPI000F792FEC|nr:hypothetical protein [Streptomyces sp. WAC08241]RSS46202.1 hypothetical protein EF906_02520 [Streptomyces sp. WAC08241]